MNSRHNIQAADPVGMIESFRDHIAVIKKKSDDEEFQEATSTPLFTATVYEHVRDTLSGDPFQSFTQFGLLGGGSEAVEKHDDFQPNGNSVSNKDPRLFMNISHPLSVFICGSQGSGKSHTLSCLLENCLIPSRLNNLPKPLTALVFHYDTFISDHGGSPCEAAYLSSDPAVVVRVFCSPTNTVTIRRTYSALNVSVEPLHIKEVDLNTKRMLDLMSVKQEDGPSPLYIQTVMRILREMRIMQQNTGTPFSYSEFKSQLLNANLTATQLAPLQQRLETLESFMVPQQATGKDKKWKKAAKEAKSDWIPKPGSLTILDLSCPCVTPETACVIFNVCLSIFLEQDLIAGRVVALDEAHKYMNTSPEASNFTETLLATIRLQRHLGARIFISTQEPTISPKLLDLSSLILVHRFTSPQWLRTLRHHLAPVATELSLAVEKDGKTSDTQGVEANMLIANGGIKDIFDTIVKLRVGEALVFSPNAMVGLRTDVQGKKSIQRLGFEYVKARIRQRLTIDGGKSVLAV